jgi:hypothetical protein
MSKSTIAPERQQALARRQELELDKKIDRHIDLIFSNEGILFSEADTVGPHQRHQLRGLLRYYAKKAHPFRACVKDNTKRFGPGAVEKVCATLKDIIRGTTHWRGHPELDHGAPGAVAASDEQPPMIDEELGKLLLSLDEDKLAIIFSAAEGE